jgi:hypothetical protein
MELTQEYVKSLFDYKDGALYWKIRASSHVYPGQIAGSLNKKSNRVSIGINRKDYLAARIIFLWHFGYLPECVDHRDIDSSNDRIENLRPASRRQNNKNKKSAKNSYSKYLGVSWHKKLNKWRASINLGNKTTKHIGVFINENDAAFAYNEKAKEIHGEFANLNIIEK